MNANGTHSQMREPHQGLLDSDSCHPSISSHFTRGFVVRPGPVLLSVWARGLENSLLGTICRLEAKWEFHIWYVLISLWRHGGNYMSEMIHIHIHSTPKQMSTAFAKTNITESAKYWSCQISRTTAEKKQTSEPVVLKPRFMIWNLWKQKTKHITANNESSIQCSGTSSPGSRAQRTGCRTLSD